jgi:hypothetical protein
MFSLMEVRALLWKEARVTGPAVLGVRCVFMDSQFPRVDVEGPARRIAAVPAMRMAMESICNYLKGLGNV